MTKHKLVANRERSRFECVCGWYLPSPPRPPGYTPDKSKFAQEFSSQHRGVLYHIQEQQEREAVFDRVAAEYRLEQERR